MMRYLASTTSISLLLAVTRPIAAQWNCGGNPYTPGSVKFTEDCYDSVQSCITQFGANASLVNCQNSAGTIYMQQQSNGGTVNSDSLVAFQDILDFCLLDGNTTGTWYDNSQWYWIAAESACYSSNGTINTDGPGFCIQDPDDWILGTCYPQPEAGAGPLQVLQTGTTANGFTHSGRGWNSWGIQALANPSTVPGWSGLTQDTVMSQCKNLAKPALKNAGYTLCSIDAGWASNDVDDNGRILYNSTRFNMPQLGKYLHQNGLQLGVYIVPGVPCVVANKTILGTDILIGDVLNGNNDGIGNCDFDFSKDGVQQWHDSLIELWASWGVDMIKLDFVTPGSPQNGANLLCNSSPAVEMYHKAIQHSGHQIRLDLSWKLCRNETWLPFWSSHAESIRTDQDIDNYGTNTFVDWQVAQRAIENYRQYILLQKERKVPITLHPDMDNLFVANPLPIAGIADDERITLMNHWLGASANLILGGDLNNIDALGLKLLSSPQSIQAADFFAQYPMQPRNPGTGNNQPAQLQAWIAGPSHQNEAYVLLVNYGPDQGYGGFGTSLTGVQNVTIALSDLGIHGSWKFSDVWNKNSTKVSKSFTAYLSEGQSSLLHLTQ